MGGEVFERGVWVWLLGVGEKGGGDDIWSARIEEGVRKGARGLRDEVFGVLMLVQRALSEGRIDISSEAQDEARE